MNSRIVRLASAWALRALIYWIVATSAVHVFMQKQAFFEGSANREYAFETMLDRTAHRPFVYRALTPWLIEGVDQVLPQVVKDRYQPTARALVVVYSKRPDGAFWTPALERKFMIAFVLMVGFAFTALIAMRQMMSTAVPEQPVIADLGPVAFGTLLPLSFMNGGFLYDFGELALMFTAFALAWRGRWIATLPVLILAVLNKETAALLVPLLAVVAWRHIPNTQRAAAIASWTVAVSAIVLALRHAYGHLPGGTMYDHIRENAEFWSQPSAWFSSMNLFVPLLPVPRGLNLLMIVPLVVLLAAGWSRRPFEIRWLLIASLAINLPLFFLFCWRDETRNLSLVYPALSTSLGFVMGERSRSVAPTRQLAKA